MVVIIFTFKDCEDKSDETPTINDFHLVLRKWVDIHPGSEFRCFVKNKNLIGTVLKTCYQQIFFFYNEKNFTAISQRDDSQFYSFIGTNREDIITDITSFFKEQIRSKFPLENYVLDVFRSKKDSVKLIDFNPFGITTDAILFDWAEQPLAETTELTTEWYISYLPCCQLFEIVILILNLTNIQFVKQGRHPRISLYQRRFGHSSQSTASLRHSGRCGPPCIRSRSLQAD